MSREERVVTLDTGVELHYVERGRGTPVVFIHGGGKDYHDWDEQLEPFAERYRVVAYSRRYAPPNDNADLVPDYSPITDAADLEALLRALGLVPAHLVGASIGGVAALFLTLGHPELVRTLVLAEPPVLRWARDVPGGAALLDAFLVGAYSPAGNAFRAGEPERAMGLLMDAFLGPGAFEGFPERVRRKVMRGARDWAAQTTSTSPFPDLPREAVRTITTPTLLLSGARTIPLHALVDAELAQLLPCCERVVIPDASHDLWADQPELCREATIRFLGQR